MFCLLSAFKKPAVNRSMAVIFVIVLPPLFMPLHFPEARLILEAGTGERFISAFWWSACCASLFPHGAQISILHGRTAILTRFPARLTGDVRGSCKRQKFYRWLLTPAQLHILFSAPSRSFLQPPEHYCKFPFHHGTQPFSLMIWVQRAGQYGA